MDAATADILAKIEAAVAEKEARLSALRAEASALEDDLRPLRRALAAIRRDRDDTQDAPGSDEFARSTIVEAAAAILRERGNDPTHYRDLAAEAHRRGYKSGRSARPSPESFQVMMNRKAETFRGDGGGRYWLRNWNNGEVTK